jgi:hypothetical protein
LILEIVSRESTARDWRGNLLSTKALFMSIDRRSGDQTDRGLRTRWRKVQENEEIDGKLSSKVLKGFYLRQAWILRKNFPDPMVILKELKVL